MPRCNGDSTTISGCAARSRICSNACEKAPIHCWYAIELSAVNLNSCDRVTSAKEHGASKSCSSRTDEICEKWR